MNWDSPTQTDFPYQMHRPDLVPDRSKGEESVQRRSRCTLSRSFTGGSRARSDLCERLGILFREDVSPSVPDSVRTSGPRNTHGLLQKSSTSNPQGDVS